MNYFLIEESPYHKGFYKITPNFIKLPLTSTIGSYSILAARIMGLSYAQYLKFCRDRFEAKLYGKEQRYIIALFKKEQGEKLVTLLNQRTKEIIKNLK